MKAERRGFYLSIAFVQLVVIGILMGAIIDKSFGGGKNAYILCFAVWIGIVCFTPLFNSFFASIPKNSGAVIENRFRTYERARNVADHIKLKPTKALREVGPGLQGLLLWERVGWVIDLGKQIILTDPVSAPTRDNIMVTVKWRVILTPLRGYLVNLVRHEGDTVRKFFEGEFRAAITQMISGQYADAVVDAHGITIKPSIFENIIILKGLFIHTFGGGSVIHTDEEQYGTFTNDPQITDIERSAEFQKSVEAVKIGENNAKTIDTYKKAGLEPNQALIAVLETQGLDASTIHDFRFKLDAKGLENLRQIIWGGNPIPGQGGGHGGGKGGGGQGGNKPKQGGTP